jgi:Ca2+-binding EF-hand superfamily protein
VFFGTESALQTFRRFDKDGDGYVSVKELKNRIKKLDILTKNETDLLLQYTNMDKKGFLDYQDFTKKLRPNMIWKGEDGY